MDGLGRRDAWVSRVIGPRREEEVGGWRLETEVSKLSDMMLLVKYLQ